MYLYLIVKSTPISNGENLIFSILFSTLFFLNTFIGIVYIFFSKKKIFSLPFGALMNINKSEVWKRVEAAGAAFAEGRGGS